jgi:DivIVA domain-containing protein
VDHLDPERVAFSDASRGRGYDRGEVDALVGRIHASLRDPTARGGVTPEDLRDVAFSTPPAGELGYSEAEVDAYLNGAKATLSGRGPREPVHCLLYRFASADQQTPALAIDVAADTIRVTDVGNDALVATAFLAEVTAEPTQYGGIPGLILDGPGLPDLALQPHPPPGEWRKRPKSRKPTHLVAEADWLLLAKKFGVAADLVDERAPQTFFEHVGRFTDEIGTRAPTTWRTPLMLGVILVVPGVVYWLPVVLLVGVLALIVAAVAWRLKWEI